MADLSDTERATLLKHCECSHSINDHGSADTCWTCSDEDADPCRFHFEDLLVERVGVIVGERVAEARA